MWKIGRGPLCALLVAGAATVSIAGAEQVPRSGSVGTKAGWREWPARRGGGDGRDTMWNDLRQHAASPWVSYPDHAVTAHENAHLLNGDVAAHFKRPVGLYLGGGRAFVLDEPPVRADRVRAAIPRDLRGSRYAVYVAKVRDGAVVDGVYEEWVCYVHGARAAVEWRNRDGPSDLAFAQLEMAVYGTAVLEVVERDAPDWPQLPQLRELTALLVQRSWYYYKLGAQFEQFNWIGGDHVRRLRADKIYDRMPAPR